jgi:hypothetical protein
MLQEQASIMPTHTAARRGGQAVGMPSAASFMEG